MPITFVSAYPLLIDTPHYTQFHPDQWGLENIHDLLSTGIQLCLYVSNNPCYDTLWKRWELTFPNLRVMPYRLDYTNTWIHHQCAKLGDELALPDHRNPLKDTYEYLVYGHVRLELLEDAISENPFQTTHFGWIDFHLPTNLAQKQTSLAWLANLGKRNYASPLLVVPGCWEKYNSTNISHVCSHIYWRFCGSFLIGCVDRITEFAELYRRHFPAFLRTYRTLTWDVNFWAWLEHTHGWSPQWYRGDHNDTILHVSADVYTTRLPIKRRITYKYPEIPLFHPGSASYLYVNGMHVLNTRFVNYWMYPNGYYLFHNPTHLIENVNVMSLLDAQTLMPLNYVKMKPAYSGINGTALSEPSAGTVERRFKSEGLEDIRLFANGTQIRFIATNINFSPTGNPRMVIGNYNMETQAYEQCRIVQPPDPTSWCEKNWIPLVDGTTGEEWFIYKWRPMELGRVNASGSLQIERTWPIADGLFSKVRGSTTFVPWIDRDYVVGLVHFSEEHSPRHYYHMLVLLDAKTWRPVKYTNTFFFEHLAIEFCIGMCVRDGQYWFWISQFDRDALLVCVDVHQIPFVFQL